MNGSHTNCRCAVLRKTRNNSSHVRCAGLRERSRSGSHIDGKCGVVRDSRNRESHVCRWGPLGSAGWIAVTWTAGVGASGRGATTGVPSAAGVRASETPRVAATVASIKLSSTYKHVHSRRVENSVT
jgi:hypothetical protein